MLPEFRAFISPSKLLNLLGAAKAEVKSIRAMVKEAIVLFIRERISQQSLEHLRTVHTDIKKSSCNIRLQEEKFQEGNSKRDKLLPVSGPELVVGQSTTPSDVGVVTGCSRGRIYISWHDCRERHRLRRRISSGDDRLLSGH